MKSKILPNWSNESMDSIWENLATHLSCLRLKGLKASEILGKHHYDFTMDKVCHSLKFIMQPVVIEPKPFDMGYKS